MQHIFNIESADSLIILDALKIMIKDPEINEEDRNVAEKLFNYIVDTVRDDLKGSEI